MRLFKCQACGQLLYFENTTCVNCKRRLGYLCEPATLTALEPAGEEWKALALRGKRFRFCANAAHDACNWLIGVNSPQTYCAACRHNRTIPDLSQDNNLLHWQRMELAKHRLFYGLLRLGLPLVDRRQDPEHGLAFDFLAEVPAAAPVLTGHDDGLIVIALQEADDAERERRRLSMGEPYRTLLGHFRHEVGHYFWDVLVRDGGRLEECRAIFGDDSQDYNEALKTHYANGAPGNWQEHFVSSYASAHPWEDFAETWAHYLHIVDTLEVAAAFQISVHPKVTRDPSLSAEIDFDPYRARNVEALVDAWLPLTFAMNSMNRAMGQADLYPFILAPDVVKKLGFIHSLVHAEPPG